MTGEPSIAFIVVAYGHAAHLPATLDALHQLDYPVNARTIIVVENGDGSSAAVARRYEGVVVMEPGRNLGFAGGCNAATAATDAAIIILVNPDLQPEPAFARQLVAALADPEVGVVGAKLVYPDGHTLQHAGGYLIPPLMLGQHYGYGETDHGQYNTPRDVEFVTGAALALRRITWEALGGLDPTFFPAYYEEVDLCIRARNHGLAVRYEPRAVAVHHEAVGIDRRSLAYHRLFHRNRLRLLFKHYNNEWLFQTWLPAELTHLRTTADDAEIEGLIDAYLHWQTTFLLGTEPEAQAIVSEPSPQSQQAGELGWTLQQLTAKRPIAPIPFRSRWPLVARLRTWWNRVATEDYLRPLIQQQNDFNASVVELAQALIRQRRTTDAAVLCQGMLLAKVMKS